MFFCRRKKKSRSKPDAELEQQNMDPRIGVTPGADPPTPGADPQTPRADPLTPGADSLTPGADPQTSGADPQTHGADPQTPGADSQTPGGDPQTPGGDPLTPGADPQTSGADPQTPGADSLTPGADSQTPGADSQTPGADSQTPGADSLTPGNDPQTPCADLQTPGADPLTPDADPQTPRADPQTPRADPQTSGADPLTPGADPQTPGADSQTPGADPQTPGADSQTPGADSLTPGNDPQTPCADLQTPGANPLTPDANPQTPGADLQTPAADLQTPAADLQTPGADPLTPGAPSDGEERIERRRGGWRGEKIDLDVEIKRYSKTKEDEQIIQQALQDNEFLKHVLKDNDIKQIIDAMSPLDVEPSDTIIKQGENGKYMYVSVLGEYEIIIDDKFYDTFNDNRVFGELAILYNNPRFATIRALSQCRVWMLSRNIYKQILQKTALAEEEETMNFLKSTPTLEDASHKKLEIISNLLNKEFYKADTIIVKQGDKGDNFYIIKSGTTSVSIDGQGVVATLERGQYFGERALLEEDCRQATVIANKPGVECLVLSRLDFHQHLGDLSKFLAKEDNQKRKSSVEIKKYSTAELEDFTILQTIGVGGFGRVELAQYKSDKNHIVAIKVLKKHTIVTNGQREQAHNEKNIQLSCNSIFIINLHRTFQNKKYLYYLMECCMGGDLFGLMLRQRKRCFDEEDARFLAGCVLEALQYLHERDIAYLDLKPENILISSNGYAKLSDFGNAVYLPNNQKTFVFAGTPEYVAPEIIYERGHDKMADYWAFGAFIFELLVGKTPFRTNDPTYMRTYTLILKGIDAITFPSRVSRHAENIIKKLCRPNRIRRLGCLRNGVDDIKKHKWFAGLNWDQLINQEIPSSFVPVLDGATDTKYFDKFRKDADVPPDYEIWDQF